MTAGLNLAFSVIRINDNVDDEVGGAQPSGTVIYPMVFGRLKTSKPSQMLLEQGLVTPIIYTATIQPGNIGVEFNDQVQVIAPQTSPHYNHKFRVIGIQFSNMTDIRGFVILTMRRIEKSESEVYQ